MFNPKEKKENNDRDRVIEMIGDMGVRAREKKIVDVDIQELVVWA